jgi:hypothetical protein
MDGYIDRDLQFEKTFLEPLRSFTDIIGWQIEKVNTLMDFFSEEDSPRSIQVDPVTSDVDQKSEQSSTKRLTSSSETSKIKKRVTSKKNRVLLEEFFN